MHRHLLGRALQYLVVLFLALTVNFLLPRAMPGDPLTLLLGDDVSLLPAEVIEQTRTQYGLDRPLHVQYVVYWARLTQGDLGYSYHWKQPVSALLWQRLPWTLLLVGSATIGSAALGVLMGTLAARRRGGRFDAANLIFFLGLDALPAFWLGLLLLILFSVRLNWLPLFGALSLEQATPGSLVYLIDVLRHLLLPAATLMLASAGGIFLITRYAMLDVFDQDYIQTARAKGLTETTITFGHAAPNALLPIVTVLLLRLGHITGGSILVESVFSYPGLGRLMYQSVLSRDYPVVQGAFLLFTVTVVAANLLTDLLYPVLDPRLRGQDG